MFIQDNHLLRSYELRVMQFTRSMTFTTFMHYEAMMLRFTISRIYELRFLWITMPRVTKLTIHDVNELRTNECMIFTTDDSDFSTPNQIFLCYIEGRFEC